MDTRTILAIVVGVIMYSLLIVLASIQKDLTGAQLILMLATPFVIGFIAGGVKKGLILGFLISLVMFIVEIVAIQPGAFANPNVAAAVILTMALPLASISTGLGALGGFLGKRVFKK